MRITKVSVEKLFGIFDHEIPLNQDSRITIIHGPNGVGKTILLQLIRSVFHCDYEFIGEIPFEQFRIEFENGDFITVKNFKEAKILSIRYDDGADAENPVFRPRTSISDEIANNIQELIPELTGSIVDGKSHWISDADGSIFLAEDILDNYPKAHNLVYGEVPDWFVRIRKLVQVRLIQTQRLKRDLKDNTELMRKIIYWYEIGPDELDDLSSRNNVIEDLSTDLISKGWKHVPFDVLLDKFKRNAKEYPNVQELSIEDEREFSDRFFVDYSSPDFHFHIILSWVLKQPKEVRDIFYETLFGFAEEALTLLYDIINERFLFKFLALDEFKSLTPDELFNVVARDGSRIPLSSLSSGEQHLIILYWHLLFGEHPTTLVMIDEPELSMNVVWQRNFLKDLQRIIELRKFDVLVATHSPQIIHDKWDWMVALGEPEGES